MELETTLDLLQRNLSVVVEYDFTPDDPDVGYKGGVSVNRIYCSETDHDYFKEINVGAMAPEGITLSYIERLCEQDMNARAAEAAEYRCEGTRENQKGGFCE